ncbi:recombinase zinc beta ribbon domain-containing protein [Phyllobacterium sp. 22552]|uniref:recombinase zinc beta ribbon domain-containing protein n=1 Tax=Phyllobacterium sp. 22552 TaxID=3453941 RepID=UPI003F836344
MKRVRQTGRPVHLLSGLLTCGCCGGKIGIITPNRYACLNHHRRGTCDNGRTITRDKIEARVLTGLKERLVSSEAVAEAVKAYVEEMNRLNRDRRTGADRSEGACQDRKGHCWDHRGYRRRHVSAEHESAHG